MDKLVVYCNYSGIDSVEFNKLRLNLLQKKIKTVVVCKKSIISGGPLLAFLLDISELKLLQKFLKEENRIEGVCFLINNRLYLINDLGKLLGVDYRFSLLSLLMKGQKGLISSILKDKLALLVSINKKNGNN